MQAPDTTVQDKAVSNCLGIQYYRAPQSQGTYMGCFNDDPSHALPNRRMDLTGSHEEKQAQCETMAMQAGDNVYGLQNEYECWTGKDVAYDRKGAAQNCPANGGSLTQQVYTLDGYQSVATYKSDVGVDRGGADIGCITNQGGAPCKANCDKDPNCKAYNTFDNHCCWKNQSEPKNSNPVVTFYTKG
jgi:hypothetical protein